MRKSNRSSNAPRKGLQKSAGNRSNMKLRFIIVTAAFTLLCLIFTTVLAVTQIIGPSISDADRDLDVRTQTVSGTRGRIFDRNGVLLVGNTENYDLVFEHGSMAYLRHEVSRALLDCIEILNDTGNGVKRAKDYFPLTGSYPNMSFKPEAFYEDNSICTSYIKFLEQNKLKNSSSADDVVKLFTKRYKLSESKYTNEEITELIRIYYEMERVGFGAYQSYTIAENINPNEDMGMELITRINERKIEGATLLKRDERVYYYEGYASHILGSLGKITAENVEDYQDYPLDALVGISGVEYAFEEYLRGSDGTLVTKYDDSGNVISQECDPDPIIGKDVYLTIDINLQIAAEDALAEEIESLDDSEAGAVTAIDPGTGETLVIASYPKYDVSQFNRALQGTYAPGSTYKVGAALAALELEHIDESTKHVCNKVYPHLGGPTCLGTHGSIGVSEAIRVSCNIFFYYVGQELGLDKITTYTERLGLGVSTGIELGEKQGIVASEEYCLENELSWSDFDNATGAIGQSKHTYTPLQLSVYMSSIVNHGTRYAAHLLLRVEERRLDDKSPANVVLEKEPEVLDKLEFSQNTYDTLIDAMHDVVSTSVLDSYFSSCGVEVGGKTGTAETGQQPDNGLFCGFAPLEEPKIVASCVLEKGEAGGNAAKVVAKVFDRYFNPPEEDETEE